MLTAASVPFETVSSGMDEETAKEELKRQGLNALAIAEGLAERKALAAAPAGAGTLILGSDQTLERADGTMFDKPASREEAQDQLRSLSGRMHRLHSAASIAEDKETVWRASQTVELVMRPLSEPFLAAYLDAEYEHIRWSVGGYRIEGPGVQLFERIQGSHFAILGLPLLPLLAYLRDRKVVPS